MLYMKDYFEAIDLYDELSLDNSSEISEYVLNMLNKLNIDSKFERTVSALNKVVTKLGYVDLLVSIVIVLIHNNANKKTIKSLLEELRLKGIGDGIVKKLLMCYEKMIEVSNLTKKDIITTLLNCSNIITKYEITLDNFEEKINNVLKIKNKILS